MRRQGPALARGAALALTGGSKPPAEKPANKPAAVGEMIDRSPLERGWW